MYLSHKSSRDFSSCANIIRLPKDKSKFGLQSLRAGGATVAANHGVCVCDLLFIKHSQWKSDFAKDGYVSRNILQQLSVSKNLGI